MDHERDKRFGQAQQRWIASSGRLESPARIKPGGSTLTERLPPTQTTVPQSPEPAEHWNDDSMLRRAQDVFRSMAPDADNLAQIPGEVGKIVRAQLPYFAGILALGVLPAILGAGPAALITGVLAFLHKVGGPVLNTAQRANVIFRLKRWFRRAWNANHRPEEIKAANADFLDLLVAVVLLWMGAKTEKAGGGVQREGTTLPATLPNSRSPGIGKRLPATSTRSLVIGQTYETVKDNVLYVNGTPVPAMAGASQTLDRPTSRAPNRGLSPSHEARDNEADAEIRYLYNKVIDYFDTHAMDTADANVYEEYMRESVYGSHDDVQSAEHAANAVWYIPELDWIAAELELRINGSIGLLGERPRELRIPSKPSAQRAKETLERIREIQNEQRMTLGDYRKIIADHHVTFGYDQNGEEYPLRHKPFRPILERRRPRSYRQINHEYTVGAGPVEIISTEYKHADGIKYDKRSYPRHDTAHHYLRPEMPSQAEAFLRHASRNIDFYTGFEQVRDKRPVQEQELLDVLWFDLSREGKDGFWPRELDPVSFALVLADEKSVCGQVLLRFSALGQRAYKLTNNRIPSQQEVQAGVRLLRDYVERYMATVPAKQQRLLEFYREAAEAMGVAAHIQPYWLIDLEGRVRRHLHKPYWEILTPKDFYEGYPLFADHIEGDYGKLISSEKRQIGRFMALVATYVRTDPSSGNGLPDPGSGAKDPVALPAR